MLVEVCAHIKGIKDKRSCGQNLWRASGRGSPHRGKRSKSIFGKRSRRIRNRRKEAKRPLDQERLSSYPFIT